MSFSNVFEECEFEPLKSFDGSSSSSSSNQVLRGVSSMSFDGMLADFMFSSDHALLIGSGDVLRNISFMSDDIIMEPITPKAIECSTPIVVEMARDSSHEPALTSTGKEVAEMAVEEINPYKKLFELLSTFSFRSDIFTSDFCGELKKAFPMIKTEIEHRAQFKDINIDIVYRVAEQVSSLALSRADVHDEKRLCYEAAFLHLYKPFFDKSKLINTSSAFLKAYPEFEDVDAQEMDSLITFRNNMAIAQSVIRAAGHKNHLMDLVTRISEGKNVTYVAGTGQSKKTSRRVLIFRREGNVPLVTKAGKGTKAKKSNPLEALAKSKGEESRRANHRTYLQVVEENRSTELKARRYLPKGSDSSSSAIESSIQTIDQIFNLTAAQSCSSISLLPFALPSVSVVDFNVIISHDAVGTKLVKADESAMEAVVEAVPIARTYSDDFYEVLNIFRCTSA